jgi:hypothetical protein
MAERREYSAVLGSALLGDQRESVYGTTSTDIPLAVEEI